MIVMLGRIRSVCTGEQNVIHVRQRVTAGQQASDAVQERGRAKAWPAQTLCRERSASRH